VGSLSRDVRWVQDNVVLALAMRSTPPTLWRTGNGGQSWEDQTAKLITNGVTSASYPQFIYNSPVNNSIVYIRSNTDISWVTYNAGETWSVIKPGAGYINLRWHPTRDDWAIAAKADGAMPTISVSKDFGATWASVAKTYPGAQYSWGDAGSGDVPENRIYMIVPPTDVASGHPDFVQTDDFGATQTLIHDKVYDFAFLEKQILILVFVPTLNDIILRVTPDVGEAHRTWYTSEFPFGEDLPINGYTILDDHTGAIYLGLNHAAYQSHWGNVYVSDSVGVHYYPSQSHVNAYQPIYDFERVHTLDGIYIANTLTNWAEENTDRDDDLVQSFITMDNGNTWNLINPPHFDWRGNPITCTGTCALHLHCYVGYLSDLFGPFYSAESSPGFVIANGNVGDYLAQQREEVNTYMSRDGGLSWVELMAGPTIYEIGDHGGIIVMAPLGDSTTVAFFTLDQGKTLQNVTLSNSPIDVYNIISEPSSTGEKFIVQGLQNGRTVLISLDFTQVFDRTCVEADYETWQPSGPVKVNGKNCLLGKDVTYKRRKADSACFNAETRDVILKTEFCECTWDDWECDIGWHRSNGTDCVPESPVSRDVPANCHGTYNISQGYRPTPGTACQGGLQLWGEGPFDCPATGKASKAWIAAAVLIPLVVVVLIIVAAFFAIRSEKLRDKLPFLNRFQNLNVGYLGLNTKPDTFDEDEDIFERRDDVETHTIEEDEDQILPVSAPATLVEVDDHFDPRA